MRLTLFNKNRVSRKWLFSGHFSINNKITRLPMMNEVIANLLLNKFMKDLIIQILIAGFIVSF